MEKPYSGRATIQKDGDSLEISIPTAKPIFDIIFLMAWLGGWYFGETAALDQVFSDTTEGGNSWFLIFWLVGWTIGGVFFILIFLWIIGGKETVSIDSGEMILGREIFGVGHYKTYNINDIKYLTINPRLDKDQWGQARDRYLVRSGLIEFDYGLRTIKFGSGIDMAEARHLIKILKENQNFKEANFR